MRFFLTVFVISLCWCALVLVLGIYSGWITLNPFPPWLAHPFAFVYRHLRLSIVPFGGLFLYYIFLIRRICHQMQKPIPTLSELSFNDRLLNTTISTFFGVGVVWTAVGMEAALMHALEGVQEGGNPGASLSAVGLLERLVNGGLLLALSTTIFGGVCGYLLRLIKIILIGKNWDRLVLKEMEAHEEIVAA